ncbi:hypothetical protein V8E53_003102 [Lactarius tabidus]
MILEIANRAYKILSWATVFPQPLKIFAILVASGPLYWYSNKILLTILHALGMCSGTTAFAHMIARRFLTGVGSKSDEKVRYINSRNVT